MPRIKRKRAKVLSDYHIQSLYYAMHRAQTLPSQTDVVIDMLTKTRRYEESKKLSKDRIARNQEAARQEAIRNGLEIRSEEDIYMNVFRYILGSRITENLKMGRFYAIGSKQPQLEAIADAVRKTREDAVQFGVNIEGLIYNLLGF